MTSLEMKSVRENAMPKLGIQTHQDIIWFDVGMEDSSFFQQLESKKELLCVGPHCFDMETNILAILA